MQVSRVACRASSMMKNDNVLRVRRYKRQHNRNQKPGGGEARGAPNKYLSRGDADGLTRLAEAGFGSKKIV